MDWPQIFSGLNLSRMQISGKRDVCQSSKNDSIVTKQAITVQINVTHKLFGSTIANFRNLAFHWL